MHDADVDKFCLAIKSLTETMATMLATEAQRRAELNYSLGRLNLITMKISNDLDAVRIATGLPTAEEPAPAWCPSGNHPAGDCECPER